MRPAEAFPAGRAVATCMAGTEIVLQRRAGRLAALDEADRDRHDPCSFPRNRDQVQVRGGNPRSQESIGGAR